MDLPKVSRRFAQPSRVVGVAACCAKAEKKKTQEKKKRKTSRFMLSLILFVYVHKVTKYLWKNLTNEGK